MRKKIRGFSYIFVFLWTPFLFGQDASIVLEDFGISQYQSIFIADFDFLEVGAAEDLFNVVISTNNFNDQQASANIFLELKQNENILATIQTNQFDLPRNSGFWRISNKELSAGNYNFNGFGGEIEIEDSGLDETADDLRDEILATSQIPVGSYKLIAQMTYVLNNDFSNPVTVGGENVVQIDITITNPTLINLITPGVLLNSGFQYELFTDRPVLQWNGNSGDYQVVVFKKQKEFSSIEDVLNSQPVWESPRMAMLSVQYPDVGALPLEYGSDYVWLVRSFIQTSSGENAINSEFWEFSLVDPSQTNTTQESMAKQELEIILRQLLGDRADAIIKQMEDYDLSSIRVNGSALSASELYQFLEKYRDQEHEIYDLLIRSSN